MKNLFLIFTILLTSVIANAQLTDVQKQEIRSSYNLQINPGFENGKAGHVNSGGSFSITLSNPIMGKASAEFDASAASQYVRGGAYTVPEGLKGQACELSIDYIGGDANLALRVLDGTNTLIPGATLTLSAATVKSTQSVFFLCPSSGSIKYEILSSADAASIKYDNVQLGSLANLAETVNTDVGTAHVSAGGALQSSSGFVVSASTGGTGIYTVNFTGLANLPACSVTVDGGSNLIANIATLSNTSATINVRNVGNTFTNSGFRMVCAKSATDARQTVQVYKNIPRTAQNENVFSARIDGTTFAVTRENVDWITTAASGGGSGYSIINFQPGLFTIAPNCVVTNDQEDGPGASVATVCNVRNGSPNTSLMEVQCKIGNATTGINENYMVICQRGGADYRTPVVQPIVVGQVTQPDQTPLKIATAKLDAGACSVSPCSPLTAQRGITSVTRNSIGNYTVNFQAGYFTNAASIICHNQAQNNENVFSQFNTYTVNSVTLLIRVTSTLANQDGTLGIYCTGW